MSTLLKLDPALFRRYTQIDLTGCETVLLTIVPIVYGGGGADYYGSRLV
jgi:hypothetical protein